MESEKEYSAYNLLMAPRWTKLIIIRTRINIEELKSCLLPKGINYDHDRVQTSQEDMLSETVARISKLESDLAKLQERRARELMEAQDAIEKLHNEEEKTILTAWYIDRKSPEEVADKVGYSVRHMFRKKRDALNHLEKIIE